MGESEVSMMERGKVHSMLSYSFRLNCTLLRRFSTRSPRWKKPIPYTAAHPPS